MSETLAPHSVLSKLEDNKCNKLMTELGALATMRDQLMAELEKATLRLDEIEALRHNHSRHSMMACELVELESARHEEILRREDITKQLDGLSHVEKQLKAEIFSHMNKSKAYKQVGAKEQNMKERMLSHNEQQTVDDLMAHRCTQGLSK